MDILTTGAHLQQLLCALQLMRQAISGFSIIIRSLSRFLEQVYAQASKRTKSEVGGIILSNRVWKKTLEDASRRFQALPEASRRFQTLSNASRRFPTLPDAARPLWNIGLPSYIVTIRQDFLFTPTCLTSYGPALSLKFLLKTYQ